MLQIFQVVWMCVLPVENYQQVNIETSKTEMPIQMEYLSNDSRLNDWQFRMAI